MIYKIYQHAGPRDGEMTYCYKPYFELTIEGAIYRSKSDVLDEYVEYVDDGTRKIDLYYVPATIFHP